MIVKAKIRMKYYSYSLFPDTDGLYISITFREPRKILRTEITKLKVIHKTDDQFCTDLKIYLSDINKIKRDAEELIREYFENLAESLKIKGRLTEAERLMNEFNKNKIKIEVEVNK